MYISPKQLSVIVIVTVVVAGGAYWLGGKSLTISPKQSTSTAQVKQLTPEDTEAPTSSQKNGSIQTYSSSPVTGKFAPEFVRPGGFSNTDPFLLKDLRGKKIVLLMFWTTSSLSSTAVTTYLNDWYAKYHNYGLSIVAIHTPRFTFERSKATVDQFAQNHNMSYPLVIDNGAETWTAYKNTTWPHLYLIDLDGRIVYDHSGEGAYDVIEKKMLTLLNARAATLKLPAPIDQQLSKTVTDGTDSSLLKSSEEYFGANKNKNLANGITGKEGIQTFDTLSEPKLNKQYLFGGWNIMREYAQSLSEHTSIIYRFHAKRVYTIMGTQKMSRVRVLLDGVPLNETTSGKDIRFEKGESVFYVDRERFYDIVNIQGTYADHSIELIPDVGGLNVYTLTFK